MRCTIAGAGIALFLAPFAVAQEDAPAVELVEFTVRKEPAFKDVKLFGQPGLELTLAAKVPGKPILSVDTDRSALVRFVDDKGTDLSKGASKGFFSWISLNNSFREEATDAVGLKVKTETLPAAGAGRVELEAKVVLISASGSVTKEQKVKLEKGAEVTCGAVPMKISDVGKPSYGSMALSVQLVSSQRMDAVKEIVFLDAAGKKIEAKSMGDGSYGSRGEKTYMKNFGLPAKVDEVTLRVTSYAKSESVELPVKLSFGAGLR